MPEEERRAVAEEYAKLTGIPATFAYQNDLRVGPFRFMKKLLEDEGKTVGRMDGRMTGHDRDPADDTPQGDPSLGPYLGVYAGAFNGYARDALGYESDRAYEVLSSRVRPWSGTGESTGSYSGGYLNVADDLESAMNEVPGLRLFVASGLFDLATPVGGTDYTLKPARPPRRRPPRPRRPPALRRRAHDVPRRRRARTPWRGYSRVHQ